MLYGIVMHYTLFHSFSFSLSLSLSLSLCLCLLITVTYSDLYQVRVVVPPVWIVLGYRVLPRVS